jgi:4-alpha-glucanotransferase
MEWSELIDRLAALSGIEPHYHDIRGRRHEATLGTKVQVIEALGVEVSSLASAEKAVAILECAPWRRVIPLSAFIRADTRDFAIELRLPAAQCRSTWRWRIELETGEIRSGEFRPEQLDLVDTRDVDGRRIERRRLTFEQSLPPGYHRLRIAGHAAVEGILVAAPQWCFLPEPLERDHRLWGLAAHVYALRSRENWGIGDFGDLRRLTRMAAQAGASFVAVNPFHALSPGRPEHASPYSPSSRLFVNPLYIALPTGADASIDELRRAPFVDYGRVSSVKTRALDELGTTESNAPVSGFESFMREAGAALDDFAVFSALAEVLEGGWHEWPARYRTPGSAAVKRFAAERMDRVRHHKYLQFLADRQLGEVASEAGAGGMKIGIIRDLALGVDPDGADAWARQDDFVPELRCGAPGDDFNEEGQEWGVLPLNPLRLRTDHRPYAELLRANMRHAGGLRIDHIIGIERQFVVPRGAKPSDGCYIRYPTDELLSLMALESLRNKCMVIGEDLGTVPEGLRRRMHDARLFGCSVLYFERSEGGGFKSPSGYRKHTIASAGTHDLPTIAGYWAGKDIEAQTKAGVGGGTSGDDAMARRAEDKKLLLDALRGAGVLDPLPSGEEPSPATVREAVHAYLAASAAQLFAAQVDDLLDEIMQLNLPGTIDAYPNWRRKLRIDLEEPEFTQALHELGRAASARRPA